MGLNLDVTFAHANTNQKSGVELSLSAQKGRCEVIVESNCSKTGLQHGYTAQIYGFTSLSAGVQARHKSFKKVLHPLTTLNNGRLFFGGTLKRNRLGTNVRFGILPVEKLKNFVSSNVNESRLDSGSPYFKEQDEVDLSSKGVDDVELVFRQKESQVSFPLNEVQSVVHQAETTEEQEKTTQHEENEERDYC